MKKLELNQMEALQGGDLECAWGIGMSIIGAVGIGLLFAFPPAAGVAALVGAVSGVTYGGTVVGAGYSCLT